MKMIVNTKSKKQEKAIKNFFQENDIDFSIVEEDAAVYKATVAKKLTKKEQQILDNLSKSVDFVNNKREREIKARPLNEFLNEF
jgi:oligoribonuclease (3'-5' exoribonuclease)